MTKLVAALLVLSSVLILADAEVPSVRIRVERMLAQSTSSGFNLAQERSRCGNSHACRELEKALEKKRNEYDILKKELEAEEARSRDLADGNAASKRLVELLQRQLQEKKDELTTASREYDRAIWLLIPLSIYHSGCTGGNHRSSLCTAAVHRKCAMSGFAGGFVQEGGERGPSVVCVHGTYLEASIGDLKALHGGCHSTSRSESMDCYAAIHRFCKKRTDLDGGIPQELGNNVIGVTCFKAQYKDFSNSELRRHHRDCAENRVNNDCFAAYHRACEHYGGGVPQESPGNGVGVACAHDDGWEYRGTFFTHVPLDEL